METGFRFGITAISEELAPQLSRVLRHCADFSSRKKLPMLWKITDRLNRMPKAAPEVLKKRRQREGIWGIVLWALSMFLLIPSAMDPAALTGPLVLSVLGFALACVAMRSTKRNLLTGLNLTMGALLFLGALLAPQELKALLVPGVLCFVVGVWTLTEKRVRRKESPFDRQARELLRQRRTIADMERMQVEFTDEGMILSDGTDTNAQCFAYNEFLFVGETEDLLVPVCGQRAIVLQKKDLQNGSMEKLRAFLQECVSYESVDRVFDPRDKR